MKPTVVVTRPAIDSQRLKETLEANGWPVITQPLLKLTPLPESELPYVPALKADDLVIFVSANAVNIGLPYLESKIRNANCWCFAVGKRTQRELAQHGLKVMAPDRQDSEGLLALEKLNQVASRQVIIVKGVGGRGLIAETLDKRGALVIDFPCYAREGEDIDALAFAAKLHSGEPLVFQANSGDTLERLTEVLRQGNALDLLNAPVVVPSARVQEQALALGWSVVLVAEDAGDQALLTLLTELDEKSDI